MTSRAQPSGGPIHPAQAAICACGWDIIRFPTAKRPVWVHQATGRPECGVDDLRRPWSAPYVLIDRVEIEPRGLPVDYFAKLADG